MESSNTAAGWDAGVQGSEDDPFRQAEGEFEQDDPFASEAPLEGVPVVDADGNRVEAEANGTLEGAAAVGEGAATVGEGAAQAAPESQEAAQEAAQEATQGSTAPTAAESPAGQEPPQEPPIAAEASVEQAALEKDEQLGPDGETVIAASAAEDVALAGVGDDTPPAEHPLKQTDESGKVVKRPYRILQPDGAGKWREVYWHEKDGKLVPKGTPGARRQSVCLVRTRNEALRIGYRALGSPPDGVTLVAVADSFFQTRRIEPQVEEVPRTKVTIR